MRETVMYLPGEHAINLDGGRRTDRVEAFGQRSRSHNGLSSTCKPTMTEDNLQSPLVSSITLMMVLLPGNSH